MRRKKGTKICAILMAAAMAILSACGNDSGKSAQGSQADASGASASESGASSKESSDGSSSEQGTGEVVKLSLYPSDANLSSGVVSGHKGQFFAENGIELEVWAYSDEKTNAMLASGDLPDILYVAEGNLDTMIEGGMILDLTDYLDQMPHVQAYEPMKKALNYVREYKSAGTGRVYGLPLGIGDSSTKVAIADSTERNAVKLRWDVYEEIGAPEIHNFDELIDVMEQMVEAHPTDENGNKMYGTVLNSGGDSSFWACMTLWYRWQGYDEHQLQYLLETDMVNGTYASILDENSMYYKGLKWYNEVYRRGLMDPDSITTDRATQASKVSQGLAMVPSGSLPGWAPKYYPYYIPDTNIYYAYSGSFGSKYMIAINANTQHLEECLKLLDMWCDADAVFRLINGPDGDLWYSDGDKAYFTDAYLAYLQANNGSSQGYQFATGEDVALWNTPFCIGSGVSTSYTDDDGNPRMTRMEQWKEMMEFTTQNDTYTKWKETTGHENWKEWLEEEKAYYSDSTEKDIPVLCSLPDDTMQLNLDAIKDIVVNASWKMVYAESEEEFTKIWTKMLSDCEGLDANSIVEWRLKDIEEAHAKLAKLQK